MSQKIILASFAQPEHLLDAVRTCRKHSWDIVDLHTPYAVHGLEEVLDWPRSRLAVACFLGGAGGAGLALWFQFWTTATDWPLNVGGRPWNSLPAFVPVVFECMVLLAGFALFFAWLIRSRLYPGRTAPPSLARATDDRFVVMLRDPGQTAAVEIERVLHECHAVGFEQQSEEEQQ
jgi:hypothetical protein